MRQNMRCIYIRRLAAPKNTLICARICAVYIYVKKGQKDVVLGTVGKNALWPVYSCGHIYISYVFYIIYYILWELTAFSV